MKAVVVEIRDNLAAVLSEDGCITKIRNKNYTIGQEIVITNNNKYIKWVVTAAAAIMLFITPAWAYLTPYSYVSVDVNPSFEFSINRFDRVLEVKAVNDDGKEIIKEIDIKELKNKEISVAIKNVLNKLKDDGYFIEGKEGGVIVATSSKTQEKTDRLAETIRTAVEIEVEKIEKVEEIINKDDEITIVTENNKDDEDDIVDEEDIDDKIEIDKNKGIRIDVIGVGQECIEEARDLGVTPGKLNLLEKLQEAVGNSEDFDLDEWLDKPVKDIMKATKEYKKEDKKETRNEISDIADKSDNNDKTENKYDNKDKKYEKSNIDEKDDKYNDTDDLQAVVMSIDKKANNIKVKMLHNGEVEIIYVDNNTNIKSEKGKNIKENNLKVGDEIEIDIEFEDDVLHANDIKVVTITNEKIEPKGSKFNDNEQDNNDNNGNNNGNRDKKDKKDNKDNKDKKDNKDNKDKKDNKDNKDNKDKKDNKDDKDNKDKKDNKGNNKNNKNNGNNSDKDYEYYKYYHSN